MLKVIIADDEEKICQLIYTLVDWEALGMQVKEIAHNGIEALEFIKIHCPDIVITDIRMPGYDGLELIEKAKEYNLSIEFIIISGYQHFDYAQKAIKYGVMDYLLKPIQKEELTSTLTKISDRFLVKAEQLSKEEMIKLSLKNNIGKLRNGFFNEILFQRANRMKELSIEMVNQEYQFEFQKGCFQMITVKLDGLEPNSSNHLTFLEEKVITIIKHCLKDYCYDLECFFEFNLCYCILNYKNDNKKSIRKQCKVLLDEIALQKDIFETMECTIGLGTPEADLKNIGDSLRTAIWAYEQRLICGTNRIIEYDFSCSNRLADSKLFLDFNREMNLALDRLDKNAVIAAIRFLREGLKVHPEISGHEVIQMSKEVCNLFLFSMKNSKLISDENNSFFDTYHNGVADYGSINQLFHYLTTTITTSLDNIIEDKKFTETKPIREAKRYILENYKNPITLDEVSLYIGFNATYFSSLFKKDTGYTFLEYLSEVRINKAKELLKETNQNISVICEQVGYSDVKHFTKMFTKYTGLKPNQYRKLYS